MKKISLLALFGAVGYDTKTIRGFITNTLKKVGIEDASSTEVVDFDTAMAILDVLYATSTNKDKVRISEEEVKALETDEAELLEELATEKKTKVAKSKMKKGSYKDLETFVKEKGMYEEYLETVNN